MKHAFYGLMITLLLVLGVLPAQAQTPLRVICVESGPLEYNLRLLDGMIQELYRHDCLISFPPPRGQIPRSKAFWTWCTQNVNKQRLVFLPDGFYSFGWDESKRRMLRHEIRKRVLINRDVDLILAIGTPAGLDMAALSPHVPVMVVGVTNAIEAGIVPSVLDSGQDNLVAIVEPKRYYQQLKYFQQILPFKRLGISYEDSPAGKSMISLAEIEEAAADLGFELVRCTSDLYNNSEVVTEHLSACHRQFVKEQVDAVYLTYSTKLSSRQKQQILTPLIQAGIPTFSQSLSDDVKNGALLSFVDSGFAEGLFAAEILLNIATGKSPRSLSQHFQSPKLLAINLRTATLLGWDPPLEVLLSIDEFFQ
ncbi:MAG: ABC transporter substrate-binding protein [Desulfovibrio sp.]|nr:ABC transporter substrate-binding protein [Desulfovibrio sp.]